jgi:hypothetical protein
MPGNGGRKTRAYNEFDPAPGVKSEAGRIDAMIDLSTCVGSSGPNL